MAQEKKIRVKLSGKDAHTAYIALPGHRHEPGIVKKAISLDDAIEGYKGPRVLLHFDKDDILIGIEVLAPIGDEA